MIASRRPFIALLALQLCTGVLASRPEFHVQQTLTVSATENATQVSSPPSGHSSRSHLLTAVRLAIPALRCPGAALSLAALDRVAVAAELSRPSAVLMNITAGGVSLIEDATARGTAGAQAFLLHTSRGGQDLLTLTVVSAWIVAWVFLLFLCLCPQCLWLLFYPSRVTNRRPPFPEEVPEILSMEEEKKFHHGLFSCIWPSDTCLFALCCMPCRHADTMKAAGLWGFYPVIFVFLVLDLGAFLLASFITYIFLVPGDHENMTELEQDEAAMVVQQVDALLHATILTIVFVPYRSAIRKKFGSPVGWGISDILSWCCCAPCAIAQEGMQIDQAQKVHVGCPCNLYNYHGGEKVLVGEPEQAGEAEAEAEAEAEG